MITRLNSQMILKCEVENMNCEDGHHTEKKKRETEFEFSNVDRNLDMCVNGY